MGGVQPRNKYRSLCAYIDKSGLLEYVDLFLYEASFSLAGSYSGDNPSVIILRVINNKYNTLAILLCVINYEYNKRVIQLRLLNYEYNPHDILMSVVNCEGNPSEQHIVI